jgi:histidinol phosphatase-like PHP family hydrolase
MGYKLIAITDHVDYSNIEQTCNAILSFTRHWPDNAPIKVLPGIELTHLPLEQFRPLAKYARRKGIMIIVAHGQTLVEPVIKGTNQAALEADIDILAHPGLITKNEVELAKKKGVFLEITTRKGHCRTNSYLAKLALKTGARLILNTDSHEPEDIISPLEQKRFALKAGLSEDDILNIYKNVEKLSEEVTG